MLAVAIPGLAAQSGHTEKIDFSRDIQPILRARCFSCHGPQLQSNGLRLDRREDALRGGYSGQVIRPGESASSRLYQLITNGVVAEGKRIVMPPTGPLAESETLLIGRWIDQGAVWPAETESASRSRAWARPWSFEPIRRPSIPAVRRANWVRNPIDAFVLAKLEAAGIEPSPQAPRPVLLRRVYLDLTGLPPTPEEAAAFLADQQPGSYERLVDRLLRSEHYGEKWARSWLDVARYADSEGGVQDYVRPFAWRYRHWVIDALNRDMPFDRFTTEQIAGDLLPDSTLERKLATGFQRNTITSREGGIDLEKLRFDQLVDRANTVGSAWLGLTVGCAQCHDHKYDPISQKDYYRLLAFSRTPTKWISKLRCRASWARTSAVCRSTAGSARTCSRSIRSLNYRRSGKTTCATRRRIPVSGPTGIRGTTASAKRSITAYVSFTQTLPAGLNASRMP
jgi:Protein of unknown function (DUF1549)/Planctomycete cytochrome C